MEIITVTGVVSSECEKRKDKRGHEYIRFKIGCKGLDTYGRPRQTQYRCFCYNMQFDNLQKGEDLAVSGSLNINYYNDKINFDIYVQHIARVASDKQI